MSKKISMSIILSSLILVNIAHAKEEHEIVVTSASKSEQSIKDITANVEVITRAQLEEKHLSSVIDVLKNIANVPMAQSGGIGQQSSFFLRGFSAGNALVLIDGIKYNDPTTTEGQAQLEHLMINDIERIEIINGAQSGVWGANAVAGVINIITQKPTEKLQLRAAAEAGSYNTQKYSASVSQKIDKLSYYLGLNYLKSDGISAAAPRGVSPEDYEKDGYDNRTLNIKLGYDISPQDKVDFKLTKIMAKAEYDSFGAPNSSSNEVTQTNIVYAFGYEHTFSSKLNAEVLYERGEFTKKDPLGWTKEFKGESSKLALKSKFDYMDGAFAVFGAEGSKSEDKTGSHDLDSSALFVTNSNKIGKLIVTESIRADFYDSFSDKTTGKIGAKYSFANDLLLSANYATGYKVPSLYQLYASTYGNQNLRPETSISKDVSIEYKQIRLTYFDNEITDLIGYNQITYVNEQVLGTSKIKGYELKYTGNISSDTLLSLGYSTLSAKNQDGKDLQRRADKSANASIDYYGIEKVHVGLSANYIGARYDDLAKTKQTGKYTLLGAVVNYDLGKKTKFYAKIDNLADKRYQEVDGYGTYGRTIFAGINSSF